MKSIRSIFFTLLAISISGWFNLGFAQIEDPVDWQFEQQYLGDDEYLLSFIANIEKGWYIYSQDVAEGGPVPTSFDFQKRRTHEIVGDVKESGDLIQGHDKFFDMVVKKYKDKVLFTARVKAKKSTARVKGSLEFMTCNDEKCLPPEEVEFKFVLKAGKDEKKDRKLAAAQPTGGILNPVHWSYSSEQISEDEYYLNFKAVIDQGWYLYSQDVPMGGPVPTSFTIEEKKNFEHSGDFEELGSVIEKFDPLFDMTIKKYAQEVTFRTKVKLNDDKARIKGSFEYMTCDDERCLPPETVEFTFKVEKSAFEGLAANSDGQQTDPGDSSEANPSEGENASTQQSGTDSKNSDTASAIELENLEEPAEITESGAGASLPIQTDEDTPPEQQSYWWIFFAGLLGGFFALLTPCVFPMIPLTVSFFTKKSSNRAKGISNGIIYAVSIIVIYVALGFIVTKLFGADALNALSTNAWFNIFFFLIFVVFAISFFGYFEITLPSWIINKSDAASESGGLIGIFFMAFTLALVSFSCTGPIIGTLLVQAAVGGQSVGPLLGMAGFATALALPFALFAAFPAWLNTLPRSGGWLNSVKVVLGFIELILAVKFLSNADLVEQWGFLKRETFLIIWIILGLAMGAYLLGWIKFPHDSPLRSVSKSRMSLSILSVAFALYLIPGIFCKTLPLVSGFPPPDFYSYNCKGHCPHHLACVHTIDDGIAMAESQNKPIMLDFTGWACVNCRKMEENVWPQEGIFEKLNEEFIIVSLYVDEKKELPSNEQYVSDFSGKKIKTVGNKWSDYQARNYGANSQPYYVLIDQKKELLIDPVGYTPDPKAFDEFLQAGIDAYKKRNALSLAK